MEKLMYKIKNFNWSMRKSHREFRYLDDESIEECLAYNKNIEKNYYQLKGQFEYIENEYIEYVKKLGFIFKDQSQDDCLFELLNNGILL